VKKLTFSILIIFSLFPLEGFCQNLTLIIEGQNKSESQTVDSLNYLRQHKDYNSIAAEMTSVQNSLQKLGYIENEIKTLYPINDSTFLAQMALKHKFNTIYIYYNADAIDASIIKTISTEVHNNYFKLNFSKIESTLNHINNKVAEQGTPFSKLALSNITVRNDSIIEAHLKINSPYKKRTINNIVIKGYEKFPRGFLKHFLKIKTGQTFNITEIKNKTEQLANLNFAKEIKPPEVLFSKDSTALYLFLEKTTSNAFDGFLGFGTNETTNKIEFNGYLNLTLNNNFHFGESFKLLYKSEENDQKTFEVSSTLPYLFKSPIGVDAALQIFKKDSSFTTVNQEAKIHYQINSKHKIFGGVTFTESSYLRSTASATIQDYNTRLFNISHSYTNLQAGNLLFPTKSQFYLETGFGKRTTSAKQEKQTQLKLNASNIFKLNLQNSIYLRLNGSYLISGDYFENELFRFGGINSIRGFEENSLYASLYGILNTEYRFKLNNSIYLHSIFDAGYFENKISKTSQKLLGYGLGFGILTNAGLFKLNYANGKTEDSNFKLSNSKIHISLTAHF